MKRINVSFFGRFAGLALLLLLALPMAAYAQRRSHRGRVVIYQSRPYVIYQQRPAYRYRTYSRSHNQYANQYYGYGYSQPYYSSAYSYPNYSTQYNYGYRQPYYGNRYTYVEPGYRSSYYGYRPRHRRSGITFGIRLR